MSTLFSILIANYNRAQYIKECFNSVLNQTYSNWEVIIVDDCSTDDSINIIKQYEKDSRFKLYKNEKNMGCGYTKKRCVDLANGDVCGFLDSDDMLEKNAISLMVEAHDKYPEVSIIGSRQASCDSNMKIYNVVTSLKESMKTFKSQLDNPFTISHFVSFKNSMYKKTEGINPFLKRAVDQDLYYKLEEQGKTAFIDKVLYFYRHSEASISLFDNVYKADAWHLIVIFETCKRRGLKFDDYCYLMKKTKSRKEKLINAIFKPYQDVKEKLKAKHNIKLYKKETESNLADILLIQDYFI